MCVSVATLKGKASPPEVLALLGLLQGKVSPAKVLLQEGSPAPRKFSSSQSVTAVLTSVSWHKVIRYNKPQKSSVGRSSFLCPFIMWQRGRGGLGRVGELLTELVCGGRSEEILVYSALLRLALRSSGLVASAPTC